MSTNNRREFLRYSAGASGIALLASPFSKAIAAFCGLTPKQDKGPFYPGESSFNNDNDLTRIAGRPEAVGQVIHVKGRVLDELCQPINDVNVEIWQACASGRYNNSRDPNSAPLDPNFKYWGETFTDAAGEYEFRSILPGAYPADDDWDRPPHIHFRIAKRGYHELITQMYFKGHPLNGPDLILARLSAEDQQRVIVDFEQDVLDPDALLGIFDITLKSVR